MEGEAFAAMEAKAAAEAPRSYPALEVALLAFIGFLPALREGFAYDDLLLVRDNRYVHGFGHLGRAFTTFFWQLGAGDGGSLRYYRPLVTTSYILDWVVSSGRPWFFHFTNLLFHAAATYLVVQTARRFTANTVLSVAIGLVFAFHPSRTESVEWIAGRSDVLMTLFLLLAVELSHRASSRKDAAGRDLRVLGAAACAVLALLCKEAAVLLPLLLLPDLLLTEGEQRRTLRTAALVQTAIAAAYVGIRTFVVPVRGSPLEFTPKYGLMTVGAYAERVVMPWPQTFFHRPLAFDGRDYVYPLPLVAAGAVLVVAYLVATLGAVWRDCAAAALLLSAAVAFGPLLNFTYTGIFVTTSDHFLYLPLCLFLLGVGRLYRGRLGRLLEQRAARLGLALLLSLYVAVDVARTFDFRDQASLYRHELALNPQNPLVLKSLSEEKARDGEIDRAFELLLASTSPGAMKYRLLMPEWLAYQSYFRLLGLQAGRTADGDVTSLELLFRELVALHDGGKVAVKGKVRELSLGVRLPPDQHALALKEGAKEILAAEAGFLGTRLGHDEAARRLLDSIGEDRLEVLPNLPNVALAYGRLGNFPSARRYVALMHTRFPERFPETSLESLENRLSRAERLFRKAQGQPSMESRRLRAEAYLELGAYLRALRELRPLVASGARVGPIGPLFVQLLVASGLDGEARAVATSGLGPEQGEALVTRTRAGLSPQLRKLRGPEGPSDWASTGEATP